MSEKKDLKKVAEFIQKKNMYDKLGKEIDSLKNELKDILALEYPLLTWALVIQAAKLLAL